MNKIKAIAFGVFIFALLACEQPFKAGLGPVVDIRDPTVALTSPGSGSYIHGEMPFVGTAEDDYILSKVEIKVTNRPDAIFKGEPYLQDYTLIPLNKPRQNYGTWTFSLFTMEGDRKVFPEGDLKIKLKVTDSVGKKTETDEIVFNVKNDKPAISVSAPYIARGFEAGDVGGDHLNYYADESPDNLPDYISFPRKVDRGAYLTGSISDDQGIYIGGADGKNYPPQIRVWHVASPADRVTSFAPGYSPSETEVPWHSFTAEELIPLAGVGNYMFTYELPNVPGNFYGFEIRAHSVDALQTKFHYPRSYYNIDDWSANNDFIKENRYVLLYIKAPESAPDVDFYGLEDIFGAIEGVSYKPLQVNGVTLDDNQAHPYVNRLTVSKNGPFTLRLRAIHQEGIRSAEVYWEKQGSGERGRFIWDLANTLPAGWPANSTVSASQPYSFWGYLDRISPEVSRNFVFTYKHDGNDKVPTSSAGQSVHPQVAGKSKIQRYTGTDDAWNAGKKDATWPAQSFDVWEDMDMLEEGEYAIEVYARSMTETKMDIPKTRTIRLDWGEPELDLITIEGEYGPTDKYFEEFTPSDADPSVVNGVIRPRVRISDSRIDDSGIRTGTADYYNRGPLGYAKEQRYILVSQDDNARVTALINSEKNWWPPVSDDIEDDLYIATDIEALRHGLVVDGGFYIKTSAINQDYNYDDENYFPDDGDSLPDGDYWLHIFARDNAFNVKHLPQKLVVRWKSDIPRFDFEVGGLSDEITEPDGYGVNSFKTSESSTQVRNRLTATENIRIRITDDDSLDLGTAADNSAIEIWFAGSTYKANKEVDFKTEIKFTDAQVKNVFRAQDAERRPVRDITGTIAQLTLLNMLRPPLNNTGDYTYLFTDSPPAEYTQLPDGIYKIKIKIKDYDAAKLTLPGIDTLAKPAEAEREFLFVVESAPPAIVTQQDDDGNDFQVSPKTNTFINPDQLRKGVSAIVSDRNGPITVAYTVTRTRMVEGILRTVTLVPTRNALVDPPEPTKLSAGIWEQSFKTELSAAEHGADVSGTYNITLTVKDRFGITSTPINQQYSIDEEPPAVSLRQKMATIDRSGFIGSGLLAKNGLGEVSTPNLSRLANGELNFIISAVDNFAVTEVRWWLLPEDVTDFNGWAYTGTTPGTPPPPLNTAGIINVDGISGMYGSFTNNFTSTPFIIDTTKLKDKTVYYLYAMALDNSGNYSGGAPDDDIVLATGVVADNGALARLPNSEIYVLQESDKPFFGVIVPDNGEIYGSAMVSGPIYEDDGFLVNNSLANSVRIWLSTKGNAAHSINFTDDTTFAASLLTYEYSDPKIIIPTHTSKSGIDDIRSQGNLNIALNLDLEYYFGELGQGPQHYIIEAKDKNGVLRRCYYNFIYDTEPPVIVVTAPTQDKSFSLTSLHEFDLIGSMTDANLEQDGGSYYFTFKFNNETGEGLPFKLDGYITSFIPAPPAPPETVNFTIPYTKVVSDILTDPKTNLSRIESGNYTLWLTVKDKSKKTGTFGLRFYIDTLGPDISLEDDEVILDELSFDTLEPPVTPNQWWPLQTLPGLPDTAGQAWYGGRRTLLENYKDKEGKVKTVPVIQRRTGEIPVLKGYFEDLSSDMDDTFIRYQFDSSTLSATPPTLGTGTITGTGKSVRWEVNLTSNGTASGTVLADGIHSIILSARDKNLNTTISKMFAFRINSPLPTVTIAGGTDKIFGNDTTSPVFTVNGTAESANLKDVKLTIRRVGGSASVTEFANTVSKAWSFALDGSVVKEKLDWSLGITEADIKKAGGSNDTYTDGEYEVAVEADDLYGQTSDEAVWAFTVDTTAPDISFTGLKQSTTDNVTPYILRTESVKPLLQGDNPSIQGRVQDALSNLSAVQRQIRRYDYVNDVWEYYNFTGTNENKWTSASDTDNNVFWENITGITGTQDYTLNWDLKDSLKNSTETVPMPDGFYSIRLRAKDSAKLTRAPTLNWGTGSGGAVGNVKESVYLFFFYASANPTIVHDESKGNIFSSRIATNYSLPFKATISSANRYDTLEVEVTHVYPATGSGNLPAKATITVEDNALTRADEWDFTRLLAFVPTVGTTVGLPDGSYRIKFTITDLAGMKASRDRVIMLDNTAPDKGIASPGLDAAYPGPIADRPLTVQQLGGNTITVSGTTNDPITNRVSSGIEEVWFHLGYGHANTSTNPGFPTEDNVKTYWGDDPEEPIAASAWFPYESGAVTRMAHIANIPSPSTPYGWSFTLTSDAITAFANYATAITINGTDYNGTSNHWMIRSIAGTSGLYSLPLWVRITDKAGNVSYESRNICVYPNGDYPQNNITVPTALESSWEQAKGGMFSIEGTATDNVSVSRVIYRVKADSKHDDGWETTDPGPANIIGYADYPEAWKTAGNTYAQIGSTPLWGYDHQALIGTAGGASLYGNDNTNADRRLRSGGWYVANSDAEGGESVAWNLMLNAADEFVDNDIIRNKGFASVAGGDIDTLRVWVEIFVLDSNGKVTGNPPNNLMSLGPDNSDTANKKPHVVVFYLKSSAPRITDRFITESKNYTNLPVTADFGEYKPVPINVRAGKFAVKAKLVANTGSIEQIYFRLPDETLVADRNWNEVPLTGTTDSFITRTQDGTGDFKSGEITLRFDSVSSTTGYKHVRQGAWATNGDRYTVEIRIVDDSGGQASTVFVVGIDNFAPVADTVKTKTSNKAAGTNVQFLGRVFDYTGLRSSPNPPDRKVEKVTAWFTRGIVQVAKNAANTNYTNPTGAYYINMEGGTHGTTALTDGKLAWYGRNAEVLYETDTVIDRINLPDANRGEQLNVRYPSGAAFVKVISEGLATPSSRMTWQPTRDWDIYWSFIADTTKMPDGWMTMHYLVEDSVGNASYYTQNMLVMNNSPKISNIVLYTDNTGEGAVFTTHDSNQAYTEIALRDNNTYRVIDELYGDKDYETSKFGYINSGFISKNRVIGFGVRTEAPTSYNFPLNYRVQYVTRQQINLTNANLKAMADGSNGLVNLYTIGTNTLSSMQWGNLGIREANPVEGNNFVFQPKTDISTTDYTGNFVWGYKEVLATEQVELEKAGDIPPTVTNPFTLDVLPDDLYFSTTAHFGTGLIDESKGSQPEKNNGTDTEGNSNNPANTAFFIIKVWDSVSTINDGNLSAVEKAKYGENDQLYDAVVVGMNVYLSDKKEPIARLYDINPYTETAVRGNNIGDPNQLTTRKNAADPTALGENILRGGLFNTNTVQAMVKSGYIEPRNGTTALNAWFNDANSDWTQFPPNGFVSGDLNTLTGVANPERDKVSGRIILRGWAFDDQLIDEIQVTLGTTTTTILKLQYVHPTTGVLVDQNNPPTGSVKRMVRPATTTTLEAWAVEELHWATGHTVEWACIWDTEKYNGGAPATNVPVQVTVKDKNGDKSAIPAPTPPGLFNEMVKLYLQKEETDPDAETDVLYENTGDAKRFHNMLKVDIVPYVIGFERKSEYNNTRSRQGWYSFYQNETGIKILGYNLGSGLTMKVGGGDITAPSLSGGRWTFSIPDDAVSGKIEVSVSDTPATAIHNHNSNHADKSWNKEYNRYTSGSDLWINKPHAHIWRTQQSATATPYTYFGTGTDTTGLSRPSMALEYTGTAGRLTGVWAAYGNADSFFARNDNGRRMDNSTPGRGLFGKAQGTTDITYTPGEPYLAQDVSFYNGGTANGALAVSYEEDGRPGIFVHQNAAFTGVGNPSDTNPNGRVSSREYGVSTQRWQNIRVARSQNLFHVSSYDFNNRRLQYYNSNRRGTNDTTTLTPAGAAPTNLNLAIDGNGVINTNATNGITASNNAGLYSAIDYDSVGPVVAYYDTQNDALRIAYASQEDPAAANWTRAYVTSANSGTGQYVSMKVDKNYGIHLAFYSSKEQSVVYAYAANRSSNFTTTVVDKVIKGGVWTDISVDNNGNPIIVYGEIARMGNYDGARMAYKSSGTTGFAFTDAWEAVSMPSNYKVKDDRLNIEAWPPSDRAGHRNTLDATAQGTWDKGPGWNAAIGYAGDDGTGNTFRIGYFTYPASKGY